jgi:hypothetical protein
VGGGVVGVAEGWVGGENVSVGNVVVVGVAVVVGAPVGAALAVEDVTEDPTPAGLGNGSAGWPASAAFIICCQTSAGSVPPKTSPTPPAETVLLRSTLPIQTDVHSCGVKPVNHALVLLSVVPVFPADGRPLSAWPAAVPPGCSTCSIAKVVSAITGLPKTSVGCGLA